MNGRSGPARDWGANRRNAFVAWGIPIAALVATIWLGHPAKTLVWFVALSWMGLACIANARRCGRVHCRFTGPFFLAMAVLALGHGYGFVPLGDDGWAWLGGALAVGGIGLTVIPEAIWGRYARS